MSETVFLTGASGFWGRHLKKELNRRGYQVFAPSHSDYDLLNSDDVDFLLDAAHPDYIIHASANCGGLPYNKANPYTLFRDNAFMGNNLIDACVHMTNVCGWRPKKVVHFSTICAYPKFPRNIPFQEIDLYSGFPEETNAPYALAKRAVMELGNAARQQHGLPFITVMPTNTYGPGDCVDLDRSHVIGAALNKIGAALYDIEANPPTFIGDGKATRDFLYVEDGVKAVVDAMERYDDPMPLNIGSGRETTIKEIVELVAQQMGFTGYIKWTGETSLNGQPKRVLNISRIKSVLNWKPEISLEEGIRRTVEWYQNAIEGHQT